VQKIIENRTASSSPIATTFWASAYPPMSKQDQAGFVLTARRSKRQAKQREQSHNYRQRRSKFFRKRLKLFRLSDKLFAITDKFCTFAQIYY
jgi:hypothetical protein